MAIAPKKIIAVIGTEVDFTHPFFDKISSEEKQAMIETVESGFSQAITFFNEKQEVLFYVLYDLEQDWLHVRFLIGNFARWYQFLDAYLLGLGKYCGKKRVTFCTVKKQVREYGKKMGYYLNSVNDYEKVIA